jgi:NTE family protein
VLEHCTVVLDRGPLDLAIRASCTVPGMFRPVWSQGRLLVDGGVSDRSGFAGIRTGERVLLHELKSNRKLRLRPYAPPTAVPGADAIMLVTPDLPRVHPFQLERGPLALEHTRAYVEAWLSEPVGQSFQSVGARGSGRYAQ